MTRRVAFALLAWIATAGPGEALAQGPSSCRVVESNPVTQEIECRPRRAGAPSRMRLTAQFAGSHDDTRASLAATLDGAPVVCAPGSKVDTQGEDGDVTLECRFTIGAGPERDPLLRVTLKWHHAQYEGFDLRAD